jgi:hypothetical protein
MEREEVMSAGNNFGEPGTTDTRIDSNMNEMDYTFHSTGSELHSKKYLHTSFGDTFFFSHWTTTTHVHTLVSCVILLLMAVLHEILKTVCSERKGLGSWNSGSAAPASKESDASDDKVWYRRYVSTTTLANGFFTGSQIALFYILVMAVMTMNVWVYLSIVIGSVVGRFIPVVRLFPALRSTSESKDSEEAGAAKTA